jgi:hypothetical protein
MCSYGKKIPASCLAGEGGMVEEVIYIRQYQHFVQSKSRQIANIAEAVWIPQYGAGTVARQAPIKAGLKFNVWIVTGSSSTEAPLFAFILQADGRILSVGGPTKG